MASLATGDVTVVLLDQLVRIEAASSRHLLPQATVRALLIWTNRDHDATLVADLARAVVEIRLHGPDAVGPAAAHAAEHRPAVATGGWDEEIIPVGCDVTFQRSQAMSQAFDRAGHRHGIAEEDLAIEIERIAQADLADGPWVHDPNEGTGFLWFGRRDVGCDK